MILTFTSLVMNVINLFSITLVDPIIKIMQSTFLKIMTHNEYLNQNMYTAFNSFLNNNMELFYIKRISKFVHTSGIQIFPFLLHKLSVFVCVPCNGLMVADRYMVIAFKREREYKGSAVIIENNLRGFSWQAQACIMIAADAVP